VLRLYFLYLYITSQAATAAAEVMLCHRQSSTAYRP